MMKKEGRGRKKLYLFTASRLPMRGYAGGCRSQFSRQKISLITNRIIKSDREFNFWQKKHIEGCGACAMYDFKNIGVTSLKVLDRNLTTEEKIRATAFIRNSLNFLESNHIPKADYIKKCQDLFKKTFKTPCNQCDCYYPDGKSYTHNLS
jgi:hypothetical protein